MVKAINNWKRKTMKYPFQTWFWINKRILYTEMSFSYIKLFNRENILYVAYPPEVLFWSLKEDKHIPYRCMTSFVYLRNLATSDIPISGSLGEYRFRQFICGSSMRTLAETSYLVQKTWHRLISILWTYSFLSMGVPFRIYLSSLQLVFAPCCGRKTSPRT